MGDPIYFKKIGYVDIPKYIDGCPEIVENKYQAMLDYALLRKSQNANPTRKPYDLTSNSCIHFVKQVVERTGLTTPWMIDPRPNSYIGEFRDDYIDLDYSPKSKILKIEGLGEFK